MRWVPALLVCAACGGDTIDTSPIQYPAMGALVGDAGKGSWRFGVATAATQIEDMNPNTDWYVWTAPAPTGLGKGMAFVGDATRGYTKALEDLALVHDLGVDSYRFSIEWARIEPQKDVIDEAAIQHYRDELAALHAMGIRPLVTVHHFSNPIWTDDPRDPACTGGPSPTNLCGLGHPVGGPLVIQEMADHAALLAQRFGDLVDEWGTVNEPLVWMLSGYGIGTFPPGRNALADPLALFVPPLRDYISAHAAMYKAIKANDTVDADGDGVAAVVGLSMSVADWEPARKNMPSTDPADLAARDKLVTLFHYMFVDAALTGAFDANLDGVPDEMHPEWANTLDWLGLQYYFRAGVSGDRPVLFGITPCIGGFDLGACLPAPDPSYCSPRMGYEAWADGIATVLHQFAARYPALPLVVTESGIASTDGRRHAETVVRILEAIARARSEGVDVRGYYHWSLTDNFEWMEGFGPRFGLYSVDYGTYARTPTEGADVLGAIARSRELTTDQRKTYGGTGPMTPEPGVEPDPFCTKIP